MHDNYLNFLCIILFKLYHFFLYLALNIGRVRYETFFKKLKGFIYLAYYRNSMFQEITDTSV